MSKFFIRRPIVAIVIAIVTVILGVVSMLTLPTAQYPDIAPPEIQIQANYAGADAKTLLQSVSTPLEQQITGVDNMLYMYSVNANNGQAQIFVDFDVKTNPDTDQILTHLRVSQAQAQLPTPLPARHSLCLRQPRPLSNRPAAPTPLATLPLAQLAAEPCSHW